MLFLITGTYTPKSLQIFINEPKDRQSVAAGFMEAAGGKLVSMHHGTSGKTIFMIEAPDASVVTAISTTLQAKERMQNVNAERLLTPAEFKQGLERAKKAESAYQER